MCRELLTAFEKQLNPADPTAGSFGVDIIGYGEVSAVLALADLPDRVLKRTSGFPSREAAQAYAEVVERYISILRDQGIPVVSTDLVEVEPSPGRHVVYLNQPRLEAQRLGHAILKHGTTSHLNRLVECVLEYVRHVLLQNRYRTDGRLVAIDAQLSNWYWPDEPGHEHGPVLIDVGTPFMRLNGRLEIGEDVFLYSYPAPLRWWLHRQHAVERYVSDYFHFGRTVIDFIGNFFKEGAPDKIPAAVAFVNDWIQRQPDKEDLGEIEEAAVRAYYAKDAATLELSLRARRLARLITTRLLRRSYDFILPGHIER